MLNSSFGTASFCKSLTLLSLIAMSVGVSTANAQVFDPGPSDPALFDTVINLPPSPDIGNGEHIGGDGTTTQLNVADGGTVGLSFTAGSGSEVNISGGIVGVFNRSFNPTFVAESDSEVNISGGIVLDDFVAESDSLVNVSGGNLGRFYAESLSEVNVSGGSFSPDFTVFPANTEIVLIELPDGGLEIGFAPGATVTLVGGEFQLNGAAFTETTITLVTDDVFTGTLADGSAFIFAEGSDSISDVILNTVGLPALDVTPIVVDAVNPVRPSGLRTGQSLTLQTGGELGNNFEAVNATLNVEGGALGRFAGAAGSEVNIRAGNVDSFFAASHGSVVNISGGTVGDFFDAFNGSVVNISGGVVGGSFRANSGSEVNISGGTVGAFAIADSGSVVNTSGGTVGPYLRVISGGVANISGGTVGPGFDAQSGSDVELIGGEFRLNGEDFSGSTITLTLFSDDVFTGTLADGSAFIFESISPFDSDGLVGVNLTTVALPALDLNPIIVDALTPARPSGLRAGQSLALEAGGELGDNFEIVNATLNVEGGTLGTSARAAGSVVNISSGTVGARFQALDGSVVNISGGSVGTDFRAYAGSVVNISGGTVPHVRAFFEGSVVNISGGTVGNVFDGFNGSATNLFGSEFLLDGARLDDLAFGEAFTITDRSGMLSGLLADGTAFSIDLSARSLDPRCCNLADTTTLSVTLVAPFLLGDVDQNGAVDFLDIGPFISLLSNGTSQDEADIDRSGVVDFLDIGPFIGLLSS